ncbi:MAG: carbon starvation protein A [Planctomycetota bacterium]|nr:MAG: carbon starvation protein A [Planctomycetota bacterium]
MQVLLMMLGCGVAFIVAYHTYGKFLARKIFGLNPNAPVPSRELNDGVDYVPTSKGILFGHHFTSIAGTGPIVGPAIGIIWGWLPAVLWIIFGSVFMGAVHDFGALVVSLRNEGKSISEIAARYVNKRVRFIFFVVVFLVLLIVIAIFGMVIAIVFDRFPSAIIPVWFQIPIAIGLGWAVYKRGAGVMVSTVAAVVLMYAFIAIGAFLEAKSPGLLTFEAAGGIPATGVWTIILLIYAWIASTLPVTTLLQPRDYINAWQLFIMMGLLIVGVAASALSGNLAMAAPAVNHVGAGTDIPTWWPLMFVTIACGAISGFHSLVASGTSPKQIGNERDSLLIGYGAMLIEGFLAILVIVCVGAGIGMAYKVAGTDQILTGNAAWRQHYASWDAASGLVDKLTAVVVGAANMIKMIGLPRVVGMTLMGVFIASFAGTTLDTAVRIQRYVISEIANDLKIGALRNRWTATTLAVLTAAGLAFATGANGKGALTLWPLFGAANQLLAGLALLIVTMYLRKKGGLRFIVSGIPCVLMLTVTGWAMILKEIDFYGNGSRLLVVIGGAIIILAVWMIAETTALIFKKHPTE